MISPISGGSRRAEEVLGTTDRDPIAGRSFTLRSVAPTISIFIQHVVADLMFYHPFIQFAYASNHMDVATPTITTSLTNTAYHCHRPASSP